MEAAREYWPLPKGASNELQAGRGGVVVAGEMRLKITEPDLLALGSQRVGVLEVWTTTADGALEAYEGPHSRQATKPVRLRQIIGVCSMPFICQLETPGPVL